MGQMRTLVPGGPSPSPGGDARPEQAQWSPGPPPPQSPAADPVGKCQTAHSSDEPAPVPSRGLSGVAWGVSGCPARGRAAPLSASRAPRAEASRAAVLVLGRSGSASPVCVCVCVPAALASLSQPLLFVMVVTLLLCLVVHETSSRTHACVQEACDTERSALPAVQASPGGPAMSPADGGGGRILRGPAQRPLCCPLPCLRARVHVLTSDGVCPRPGQLAAGGLPLQGPRPAPRPRAAEAVSVTAVNRPRKGVTPCPAPSGSGPDNVIMSDRC